MNNKLISFSIKNFKPFKNEKVFDTDIENINIYTITGEMGVGKSNILKAINLAQFLLINSYKLFSFVSSEEHSLWKDKPIEFGFLFKIKEKTYKYSFSFLKNVIIKEKLIVSEKNKDILVLFNRSKQNIFMNGIKANQLKLVKPTELLMSYLAYNKNEDFIDIYNFLTKDIVIRFSPEDSEEFILSEYSEYFNKKITTLKELYLLYKKDKKIFEELKTNFNNILDENCFLDKYSSNYKAFMLLFIIKYCQLTNKVLIVDNLDNYLSYSFITKISKSFENIQLIGICNCIENFYIKSIKTYNIKVNKAGSIEIK